MAAPRSAPEAPWNVPEGEGDSVKATVPERARRQGPPRQSHPAGMAHPATRLRLVADHGRLLPQQQAIPRQAIPRQAIPRQAVPRRAPARQVTARPGRIPRNPVPERTPIRLTRRGRVVVAAAIAMLIGAVSLALALVL
jgi:hypothetical protein